MKEDDYIIDCSRFLLLLNYRGNKAIKYNLAIKADFLLYLNLNIPLKKMRVCYFL